MFIIAEKLTLNPDALSWFTSIPSESTISRVPLARSNVPLSTDGGFMLGTNAETCSAELGLMGTLFAVLISLIKLEPSERKVFRLLVAR